MLNNLVVLVYGGLWGLHDLFPREAELLPMPLSHGFRRIGLRAKIDLFDSKPRTRTLVMYLGILLKIVILTATTSN